MRAGWAHLRLLWPASIAITSASTSIAISFAATFAIAICFATPFAIAICVAATAFAATPFAVTTRTSWRVFQHVRRRDMRRRIQAQVWLSVDGGL